MTGSKRAAAIAAGFLLASLPLLASPGRAEIRPLEVVGAVPLDSATRRSGVPKDRAIEEALWQGVSRVASDLLAESLGGESAPDAPEATGGGDPLRKALGDDMLPYARRFRIVEDQGERPALFTDHPDAATEYVVVVAVDVDVERVRERLLQAGLIEQAGGETLTGMRLEVRGLTQYRGYQALTELLLADAVGAASVDPVEFERGLAVLRVQADRGPGELLERLLAAAPPHLRITPVSVDEGPIGPDEPSGEAASLVLAVEWTPPPDEPGPERGGATGASPPGARRR